MIKLALLGFGNVGSAFARFLEKHCSPDDFQILAVADVTGGLFLNAPDDVRRLLEMRDSGHMMADCRAYGTFCDVPEFINSLSDAAISVLVECLPTNPADGQPGLSLIRKALEWGINVVTVDKGPLVHGFQLLTDIARANDATLAYSGTTGVRPPAGIGGAQVLEIRGILNGTTNYILTEMQERGLSFQQALDAARANGIAEPDPTLDVQGWDTACKLLILANEWMHAGLSLNDVLRIGIGNDTEELISVARSRGDVVRLIGRARRNEGRVRLSVAPKIVSPDSIFYSTSGTSKAALFRTRNSGEIIAEGVSGREAIAQIILNDIKSMIPSDPIADSHERSP